jgi:predicted metal-dependent peptidase
VSIEMMETSIEARALERIAVARARLVSRMPFLGYLALRLKPRIARPGDNVESAAVALDGTLVVNPQFVDRLTGPELTFLVAHEVLHPALGYFARLGARVPWLWNVAHDHAINLILEDVKEIDLKLIEGSLAHYRYHGWAAERIYQDLVERAERSPRVRQFVDSNPLLGDARGDLAATTGAPAAVSERRRLETEWRIATADAAQRHQVQRGRGSLPGSLLRLISSRTNPQVDWRSALARWMGQQGRRSQLSWGRPSRRAEAVGERLPSRAPGCSPVVVLIDTSGSVSKQDLEMVLGEVQGICEELQAEVRVLVIDAELHDDVQITEAAELAKRLKGGGGSDFRPAFELLEEEGYQGLVVAFTDGFIAVPEMPPMGVLDTLFCLFPNGSAPTSAWGQVISLTDEGSEGAWEGES